MKNRFIAFALVAPVLVFAVSCSKNEPRKPWDDEPVRTDVLEEGYYKDIFMDGGVRLTGRTNLPSADALGLSLEFFACPGDEKELAVEDTTYQRAILSDSDGTLLPADDNGVLLYPDGEPRFRMIYMNGGQSSGHTASMQVKDGCQGMQRIRDFYYNGGSYVGTCAGAFMTGTGYDDKESYTYLRICAFKPKHTHVSNKNMSMTVEPGCPLLDYYKFGGDNFIADIHHNGGCYANDGLCAGAEPLLRYSTASHEDANARECNGKISSWAYKEDIYSGRICAIGSHPEGQTSGEQLDLMCAFEKYAIEGRGIATIKDTLENGKEVAGNRIGDLQNHHFAIWVPEGAKDLEVTLNRAGDDEVYGECELQLAIKKGDFAMASRNPDQTVTGRESFKGVTILEPEKGLYYVCVHCATTVESTKMTYTNGKGKKGTYFKYSGHTEVLNGVPYTITATWK